MNRKRCGELSELAFLYKASSLGLNVSKPYGDSSRYDFVVEHHGRVMKVQVKSTSQSRYGGHYLSPQRRSRKGCLPYLSDEVDYIAARIVPEDLWYIIPLAVIQSHCSVRLYPQRPERDWRFGAYREAWDLLRSPSSDPGLGLFTIDACADEAFLSPAEHFAAASRL
ncbi:MAG: group I intron-associated PD-(D/E)XK endonuclease [Terriglobales bacterium]